MVRYQISRIESASSTCVDLIEKRGRQFFVLILCICKSTFITISTLYIISKMSLAPGSKSRSATPTVFEQQREELVRAIAVGMEQVLQNINRLNRNLESIISVGNEFSSVEALWSQFENFMGRPEGEKAEGGAGEKEEQQEEGESELRKQDLADDKSELDG